MANYSSSHKRAPYDYQIYRELQGKARLQAKSWIQIQIQILLIFNLLQVGYISLACK